jgi:ribosomal protein S8
MIEKFLNEYLDAGYGTLRLANGYEYIIYKGFKITKDEEGFNIIDTRFHDFYSKVKKSDLDLLESQGFIKGCDIIMYNRDIRRANRHRHILEELTLEKESIVKSKGKVSTRKYRMGMDRVSKEIRHHLDKLFLYNTRKKQIEIKYNLIKDDE